MHQDQTMGGKGTLYVVATPIGNLRDITQRALDVLKSVTVVAAEDTRNSAHLLAHYGVSAKLMALHEHNERGASLKILGLLAEGRNVALVSDAGTPGVSDPGAILVRTVRDGGFPVVPLPGPSAVVCALSAAGLDAPHFLFYGFLPAKTGARRKALAPLRALPYVIAFYEAPHRIEETVADLLATMGGEREITFARELTKLFEQIHTCPLSDAPAWLEADPNHRRGEFVLLLSGSPPRDDAEASAEARHALEILLRELPLKQAVKLAAEISGEKKNTLYELALRLK